MEHSDVIIIGSGIAALQLAKNLRRSLNVRIITKFDFNISNSYLAQGGIAAAVGETDLPKKHFQDTVEAGSYHNDFKAVEALTKAGPGLIQELIGEGCKFDRDHSGKLMLGLEGAHHEKRIIHGGGDATGKYVADFLKGALQNKNNISIVENIFVYELMIDRKTNCCFGVKAKNRHGNSVAFTADHIVIAAGGCGQLYSYTSNAESATGDGVALAYRAGAEIADMEFIQFHPTLLYVGGRSVGLVSEAVRGEGGVLVTEDGVRLMEYVHPLKDLAPRHIVSQTIYNTLQQGKKVFLDISSIADFKKKFPTISSLCERNGVDIEAGLLPVVPGSHFLMGGVKTTIAGGTNIEGLYVIGEAACTGVHGANRLASNSLLEGLFSGRNAAAFINEQPVRKVLNYMNYHAAAVNERITLPSMKEIQERMMEYAGIVRTEAGLSALENWISKFQPDQLIQTNLDLYDTDELTIIFMLITADLIVKSARARKESRGGHFRADYPAEDNERWLRKKIIHCTGHEKDGEYEQIKAAYAT